MNGLLISEAARAPLQEDDNTLYTFVTRAFILGGELYYYRVAERQTDCIEVFDSRRKSLGIFRTLDQFKEAERSARERHPLPTSENGRALYRDLCPLVGRRVVGIDILEASDCPMPFSVLRFDDGREIVIQSDPEGNDGGFPNVIKPTPPEPPPSTSSHSQ